MKTKIKRNMRSVLSVILAVALLLSSSVVAMFISNAVIDPSEPVSASVTEEGVVGADDDSDAVGADEVWLHWGTSNQRSAMTNNVSMSGSTVRTCTLTTSGNTYFIINGSESDHSTDWLGSDITVTNNLTSISSSAWANITDINDGSVYYICQYWCSNSSKSITVTFDTTSGARKITLAPSGTDVCSSVSLTASPSTVTSSSQTFSLTASVSGVPSALSGKSLTYTFYNDNNQVIGTKTSSSGSATLTGLTQSVRTKKYKVTVSYSGYLSKTSSEVTVTNSSVVSAAFNLLGELISDWSSGQVIDQVDSSYGANIFYKEVTVTETGSSTIKNRFRLKRNSDSHLFGPSTSQQTDNGKVIDIDGDPFTLTDLNTSTDYFIQFNPTTTGTYRIYVDQTSTSSPKVWVEGERDIFITSETTFNNYVTESGGHTYVDESDVASFESDANTGFVGYKSGNIWKADSITSDRPFMISNIKGVEYDLEYSIRDDLCTGVTFTQDHIRVGDEEDGEYAQIFYIRNNVVNSNKYTKNIILHIDKVNQQIWATSTFDQTGISSTTTSSTETVRYYFAVTDEDYDKFVTDGKLHVHYWNNSLSHGNWGSSGSYYGGVGAVPVNKSGSTTSVSDRSTGTSGNTIHVDLSNPIAYTVSDSAFTYQTSSKSWGTTSSGYNVTAYIYCADIPVWATSFAFANSSNFSYCKYNNGAFSQRGIVLNPNRVYLAYGYGTSREYYTMGIRLDESLWDNNTSTNADEASKFIKTFKTNLVKYVADTSGDDQHRNPAMNKALRNEYASRGIANELYFGGFWDYMSSVPEFADSVKPINWKVWNNLAQRKDGTTTEDGRKFSGNCAYYATVWDLAGNVLDKSKTNNLGGYLLTDTYQKDVLPFFDYDTLSTSGNGIGTLYKNVDFPFYKTTYKGVTSYSYDSMSDYNREYSTSTGKYTYTGYKALNGMQGYQPFSDQTESFANEFDIDFYMTPTGALKDSSGANQDISFNFSGDDDVWVYIDGVKVLDLGGDHMISAGSINLTDMKAYYKTPAKTTTDTSLNSCTDSYANSNSAVYTVDLAKLFEVYGVEFNNKDASTQHKLQMFYAERGENESNCSISFNLPQNSGLRIQNEIDTSGVNDGLKAATLLAADHDYFSYYIENQKATSTQRSTAMTTYSLSNMPAVATGLKDATFYTTTPKFPANNTATVKRKNDLLLLTGGITTGADSAAPTLSGSVFGLSNLNYSLTDAYSTGTIDDTLSGRVINKSGTNGVNLNLLYGQSATFNDKITPHTWLIVKQENALYSPTDDGSTIIRSTNTVDTGVPAADQRNASRFYSTTYTITDDSATKLLNKVTSVNNMEEDVVTHTQGETTGAYFSNYSDTSDADENVAATYKFVNTPHTGSIKIEKVIDAGSQEPNLKASFEFTIQFKDVFGIVTGDDFDDYDIKYRVYSADGSYVDRNYNATNKSILLRHGQYAEILGIPAGTKYQIKEKERSQYELEQIKKDSYRSGVLKKSVIYTNPTDFTKPSDIDYLSKDDSGAYLADFTFTNKKVALKVVLHYYDRKMENGVPVDINTTPSEASITYSEAPGEGYEYYKETEDDSELMWIDTEKYITNAVEGKLDNVVDKYSYWTTNTKAKAGIQTKKSISYSLVDGTYVRTLTPYAETAYHLDAYGKALTSTTDADKWVTYYNKDGDDITSIFTDAVIAGATGTTGTYKDQYQQLARIDVWVFNEPKEYTATVHGAASLTNLADVNGDGSVMVGRGATGSVTDYYNTRFGETAGSDPAGAAIDAASNYMQQYGRLTQFTGSYPSQMTTVERTIDNYKFVGWATDPYGKNIFTNDYYCGYRILSNIDLYPVYMENPTEDFGLTITPNVKDTYVAANGTEYTRLNVTFNPYNTTGDNDDNISDIAMVNIRMADDFAVNQINLDTVRDNVLTALNNLPENSYGAHTITVTVKNKDSGADVTKPVRSEYNANELNYLVTFDEDEVSATTVKLNNKNRVMLTQTYNSSLLASGKSCYKLLVLGAMKYNGTWTISNNYLHYVGGVCQ